MLPNHIGMILDGNRRFARQLLKKPWEGHLYGLQKAREVVEWACDRGIKYMTAYTLSLENLHTRPKKELEFILDNLAKELEEILENNDHVVHKRKVHTRFIGRIALLPERLQMLMREVQKATANYKKHILNLAVAYGGQQEIADAARSIAQECVDGKIAPSDIDEKVLGEHLYTNGCPYPDLIIRSGGEQRLSNFLPFQSAYSELVFTDKKWPELTKKDFEHFLQEYEKRQRRFGK
ncbi:MAG: di-trans,poly-cis-decaprenylcistransferase [Candidatus Aenigmarchaeota archaeon]|nr:di-trans,poly-cis-decaprenylcistransferase [Candidatus Aenigmarchaeota archaeon]